jgi:hypothetical protein
MSFKQTLSRSLIRSHKTVALLVSDLSDADLLVRPVPQANHIAWQLGHLILRQRHSIGSQDLGVEYPELTPGFEDRHSDAAAGMEPPCGFLSKAEYLALWTKCHAATMAALASLSDADLDRPSKYDAAKIGPTLGDLFLALTPTQCGPHIGQFAIVRRKLGKPVLY